ncbi:efflux RND transporter permease subunit [Brevibacterium casei]|uniref:efflux RND transporter permease subunit n=1 Tax=Brevibacterium casei TaxID=33889 RepID=UPI00223C1203|nr:efflux RND transporter permease subunit [Brevibacterium casei]MCT1549508.1 efflux RND transporter permease subunit [Brevibacterium casei]MCT1560193.1 efflux RND transporter permease subunit [Brevibacterium casei]MCT2208753.1 efflux RND transporter permease subunit [Brevibacterium casei]
MSFLTRLSLKNRALIALISVVAVIFGVIGAGALKQELFPSLDNPQATVTATYEGATPQAVESEVTDPLEAALSPLPEVEDMTSVSSAGSATITVSTKYGENSDDIVRSLQRAVSQVQPQLPDGVEPNVLTLSTDDIPVLALSVTSDADEDKLAAELNDIVEPELSKVDGVSQVQIAGAKTKQVEIRIREDDLEDEGASIDEIAGVLQANGVPTSAGDLEGGDGTAPVEVGSRIRSVDAIKDLVVSGTDGPVKLSDVADVAIADAPIESISRTNGKPSLSLSVMKESDANTVDVSHAVSAKLPELAKTLGDNTEFVSAFDQAPFIEQSIDDLLKEGMLGLVFAVLVILVFLLSVRATIITAISIPLSLLIALIGLWMGGETLNMLTLGALTISVGRVVDDSIVVIEAIRRRHAAGGDKFANILAAVAEVAGAITASTLTTVAVFLPLAFVTGQTGEMFRPFALTATIALLSSLFVALTIVPVLAYWFLRQREAKVRLTREEKAEIRQSRRQMLTQWRAEKRAARKAAKKQSITAAGRHDAGGDVETDEGVVPAGRAAGLGAAAGASEAAEVDELAALRSPVTRLQRTYLPVISFSTKHPVLMIVAALIILAGTGAMVPQLKTELFGDTGQEQLQVTQTFDPGTDLDEASEQSQQVEDILVADDSIESYQVSIGGSTFGFADDSGLSGTFIVNAKPGTSAQSISAELQRKFDALEGVGQVELQDQSSAPGAQTIDVTLTSSDTAVLEDTTEKVAQRLEDVPGAQSVTSDVEAVQPVIEVKVDQEKAAEENLTEAAIGQYVQRAMRGQSIGEVIIDDVTHSVLLFDREANTVEELRDLQIPGKPETPEAPAGAGSGAGAGAGAGGGAGAGSGAGTGASAGAGAAPAAEPRLIDLDDVADVEEVTTAPNIRHTNSQRSTTVSVTPEGDDLGAVSAAVQSALGEVDVPDEVSVDTGGATEEQQDAFSQLGLAMLAAILIVFVIMVATFKSLLQPLILLVSIPFAATGSIALLLLTDTAMGLTAMIGLLMLIGIVVTNAIVLIDLINHFRARGVELRPAIVGGARLRYRPILMTAAATIFALVPMALGLTGGGVFISKPLAIVVIGGLVSSTILTLILVPVLYLLLEGAKERRAEKRRVKNMARGEVLDAAEARAERETATATTGAGAGGGPGARTDDGGDARGDEAKH